MYNCAKCKRFPSSKCTLCNVLMCAKHRCSHIDDDKDHNIITLKSKINSCLDSKTIEIFLAKVKIIDKCSIDICKCTESLLSEISRLKESALKKVGEYRIQYLQIIEILRLGQKEDQIKEIQKTINTELGYEKPESIDDIHEWLKRDILIERPKNELPKSETKAILLNKPKKITKINQKPIKTAEIDTIETKSRNIIYVDNII